MDRVHEPGGTIRSFGGGDPNDDEICHEGEWKTICCPKVSLPRDCRWLSRTDRQQLPYPGLFPENCGGLTCVEGEFELANVRVDSNSRSLLTVFQDRYNTPQGFTACMNGRGLLCCKNSPALQKCKWTGCGKGTNPFKLQSPDCPPERPEWVEIRGDKDDGSNCSDGESRSFCCPQRGLLDNLICLLTGWLT